MPRERPKEIAKGQKNKNKIKSKVERVNIIDQITTREKLLFQQKSDKAFNKTQGQFITVLQFIMTILSKLEIDQIFILIKYSCKLLTTSYLIVRY